MLNALGDPFPLPRPRDLWSAAFFDDVQRLRVLATEGVPGGYEDNEDEVELEEHEEAAIDADAELVRLRKMYLPSLDPDEQGGEEGRMFDEGEEEEEDEAQAAAAEEEEEAREAHIEHFRKLIRRKLRRKAIAEKLNTVGLMKSGLTRANLQTYGLMFRSKECVPEGRLAEVLEMEYLRLQQSQMPMPTVQQMETLGMGEDVRSSRRSITGVGIGRSVFTSEVSGSRQMWSRGGPGPLPSSLPFSASSNAGGFGYTKSGTTLLEGVESITRLPMVVLPGGGPLVGPSSFSSSSSSSRRTLPTGLAPSVTPPTMAGSAVPLPTMAGEGDPLLPSASRVASQPLGGGGGVPGSTSPFPPLPGRGNGDVGVHGSRRGSLSSFGGEREVGSEGGFSRENSGKMGGESKEKRGEQDDENRDTRRGALPKLPIPSYPSQDLRFVSHAPPMQEETALTVHWKPSKRSTYKAYPLHWAVMGRSHRAIRYLIQHGADPDLVVIRGLRAREIAIANGLHETLHVLEKSITAYKEMLQKEEEEKQKIESELEQLKAAKERRKMEREQRALARREQAAAEAEEEEEGEDGDEGD